MALKIPERFHPALKKVASLTDVDAAALHDALQRLPVVRDPAKTAAKLLPRPADLTARDIEDIITVLGALMSIRSNLPLSPSKFVDELCDSLVNSGVVERDNVVRLKERLVALLDTDSVVIGTKATEIQREHQQVFMGARVYSDLRPVFSGSTEVISGALIVHNLRLTYMHQNEPKELFLAMDDEDLETLQKAIVRAQAKSRTLVNLMKRAEIIDLSQDDEE